MHTRRFTSAYFRAGQVLETFRGDGVYQLAVDVAIQKLREHKWVHLFPEGKVNQSGQLLRFRWGCARLLMEASSGVEVIPICLTGSRVTSLAWRCRMLKRQGAGRLG